MVLNMRPGRAEDADQINKIRRAAFAGSLWTRVMMPNGLSDNAIRVLRDGIAKDFSDKNITYMVIEDTETGALVASSKWEIHKHERPESEWNVPMAQRNTHGEGNQEAIDFLMSKLHNTRLRLLQGRPHVLLDRLETAPEYQGKGAGASLVKWGTSYADELGLSCYLEATAAGHKLYTNNGFEDVEGIYVEFSRWGVNESNTTMVMQRPTATGYTAVQQN